MCEGIHRVMQSMRAGLTISSFVYKKIVRELLEKNYFLVEELSTPTLKEALKNGFQLLVADERAVGAQMVPLFRSIRAESNVPVIFLVGRKVPAFEELKSIRDVYPIIPGLSPDDFRKELEALISALSRFTKALMYGVNFVGETSQRREPKEVSLPPVYVQAGAKGAYLAKDTEPENGPSRTLAAMRKSRMKSPGRLDIILIGASTGGVGAVSAILKVLPDPMPPIVIVQHTARGSSKGLCRELSRFTHLPVVEAAEGKRVEPCHIYIAPTNDEHLVLVNDKASALAFGFDGSAPVHHQRPAVDITFRSAAEVLGQRRAIAVLLTGMGRDGAEGLLALKKAGVYTIAESENTSVVWGMPKAAIDLGAADEVLDLPDIGVKLSNSGVMQRKASD